MFITIVLMVLMLMLRLMVLVLLVVMVLMLMPILVDPGTLWDNVDRPGQTWPVRYLAGRTRDL